MEQTFNRKQGNNGYQVKGFSLIELMGVIGIIAILASIAMIMIGNSRTKAFNSAALSDVKTIINHEEALYLDYGVYGTTHTKQTKKAKKKGKLITGTNTGYLVTNNNSSSNPENIEFRPSEDVSIVVASESKNDLQSFVITAKHLNGDRRYCFDSEGSTIYYDNTIAAGTKLKRNKAISAKLNRDDCANAGMSPL